MSYTDDIAPKSTNFADQPRYIKGLVFITFPIYGGIRLSIKAIDKFCTKTWNLTVQICKVASKVYNVCADTYNKVAPKIWDNFVNPWIVMPVKIYIIHPIVRLCQITFDVVSSVITTTYNALCTVFSTAGDLWNSHWNTDTSKAIQK